MRAAFYCRGGDLQVGQLPPPVASGSELLVKVAASSVNPVDLKIKKAKLPSAVFPYPKIPGSDGSGVVLKVPPNSKFKVGDLVYWMGNPLAKYGSAAALTVVPGSACDWVPKDSIDVFSAAALPLVVNTAYQALSKSMPLAGKQVLIQAGSGGVGAVAIQMAVAQGAHVTTTCSAANVELCRSLGAETCVDYKTQRFEDFAPPGGFDCVLNSVGGDYNSRSLQITKRGGHFAQVMMNVLDPTELGMGLYAKALTFTGRLGAHSLVAVQGRADLGLQQTSKLISEGKLRPVIGATLPLDAIGEAHAMVGRGSGVRGKVVVKIVQSLEELMEGVPSSS